jgi:hypothetical protein
MGILFHIIVENNISTRFEIYLDHLQFLGTILKEVQSFYDSWNVSRRRCFAWINRATLSNRAVGTGGRGNCPPASYFGRSVDPISTGRANYAHLITTPPRFLIFRPSYGPVQRRRAELRRRHLTLNSQQGLRAKTCKSWAHMELVRWLVFFSKGASTKLESTWLFCLMVNALDWYQCGSLKGLGTICYVKINI